MIDKNEIKKELYKLKTMAKFSHYVKGNLFYTIDLSSGRFQFPIPTVEMVTHIVGEDGEIEDKLELSSDLGETKFNDEIKGSELIRWITKAIDNDTYKEIEISDSETLIESLSKDELIKLIKKIN